MILSMALRLLLTGIKQTYEYASWFAEEEQNMKISIRMDDITPDMDWKKFFRFKELCDQYQIKPLLGIVPENRDQNLRLCEPSNSPVKDFWEYMRQLEKEGWCFAQHGVYHEYVTKKMGCFPLNNLSEFAGMGYESQYETLKKGRDILRQHHIKTDLFMAPAHSFDHNTIRALKELGFRKITDGFGNMPYKKWGMTFYPISYKQSSSLKSAKGYTTFVVHANTMNSKDFERYERLFYQYKDRLISYTELLEISPKYRNIFGSIKEYVMAVMKFAIIKMKEGIRR